MDTKAKADHGEYYKMYLSSRWRAYRREYLKAHPVCCVCQAPATTVDHIIPARSGGQFWDSGNHQPLCASCHSRKTAREDGGFGNGGKHEW